MLVSLCGPEGGAYRIWNVDEERVDGLISSFDDAADKADARRFERMDGPGAFDDEADAIVEEAERILAHARPGR